jgi:hypothetical protein
MLEFLFLLFLGLFALEFVVEIERQMAARHGLTVVYHYH